MKILIWLTILASSIFLAALIFVVNDFGGHSTNQSIRQSVSPDGRLVAEMRQVTTPMNGGPDTLEVTIKEVNSQSGDLIYSQVYGCSLDYSGYTLTCKTPAELVVTYGACDGGRWRSRGENKVLVRQSLWKDVKIDYHDSGYMAHGTR